MKKAVAVMICVCMLFTLASCAEEQPNISSSTPVVQASGKLAVSIEDALTFARVADMGETCVIVGTMTNKLVAKRQYGDVRVVDVQQVLYGDVTEVRLGQMDEARLETGKTYLMLIQKNNILSPDSDYYIENKYDIVGYGNQCAFWIEDGKLCGNDANLVAEIEADDPTVDTMDELVDYFIRRIDDLQQEDKLPPDPVDWPGLLAATGGLVVLGGVAALLVRKRNRVAV